jgi:branched-chain amino acid transport system substrate-binding protein
MIGMLLSNCSEHAKEANWRGPARVALVAPLTGALKDDGQMLQLGALTAMHEARVQTGNRKVEMVVYDSPCDAEGAAHVARRLAGDSSVFAVVGYLCAETLRAALPIYEEADLALINPTVSADYVRTRGRRHLFSLLYGDGEQAAFLATYVKKGLGLSKVAVLNDGSAYGGLLMTSFLAEAERQGLGLVAKVAVTPDESEVARAVQLMKGVRPEAIFLAANENASSLFLLERRRQQLPGKVLGPDRLADLDLYEIAGKAADGLLVCQPILLEKNGFDPQGFVRRFEMLHKRRPDWVAAVGYDATRLALGVFQRSGKKRAAFLQAMQDISGPGTSFTALSGPIFFREDGTSQRSFFVAEIHGGGLRAAEPSSVEFTGPSERN